MKIRARMLSVGLAVALPQFVGLLWWDGHSRHRHSEMMLSGLVERAAKEPGAQERCLEDPEAWELAMKPEPPPFRPRHRGERPPHRERGPEVRDHDAAPPRRRHRGPKPPTLHTFADPSSQGSERAPVPFETVTGDKAVALSPSVWSTNVYVALRTGWGGDCEYIVGHSTTVPGFFGSVLPATPVWIAPIILILTLMWLAVGPPVRRVRELTAAVRRGEHQIAMAGDDEIAELSRAFQQSATALASEAKLRGEREEALREFVANTAHDLRIPLTVLRGHLSRLETQPSAEALEQSVAEAHYLGALIDTLAAEARLDAPRQHAPTDLCEVVARVVARHLPISRRRQISLEHGEPDEPVLVSGDVTLIEQALSNLVYNAVHYNQAGGHVALTLDVEGDRFSLQVHDDGPGVSNEELKRITERGFRGSLARGRDDRGSGLGLSIVTRVAADHDWQFTIEAGESGGLLATLTGAIAQS